MLPLGQQWYRHLLVISVVVGIWCGIFALIYSAATTRVSDFLIGAETFEFGSGQVLWIPLVSAAGLVIALLRAWWNVPEEVPGTIAMAKSARIDVQLAPYLVTISAISMMLGASLGPSFGLVVGGGWIGALLVARMKHDREEEASAEFTLTGMAGALGAAFTAPLFAGILAGELSPTPKKFYVAALLPQLVAASIGYAIFYGITGETLLGVFQLPAYDYDLIHLPLGVLLGTFAAMVVVALILTKKLIVQASSRIRDPRLKGLVGGALVGLIAFLLPLTASAGTAQLDLAIDSRSMIGIGLLLATLIAKIFAIALSQESGFLGGVVFPVIFVGGIAGLLVHAAFPSIPAALAVAALISAVPGALLDAPVSMILIGAATVGVGFPALVPIAVSVVTARILISIIAIYVRKSADPAL